MMRQYELVERVKRYDPQADEAVLNRAYVYAMMAHGNQTRASGDPFVGHPLEVAAILTDLKVDTATIVAAVLHDTVEDTAATLDEITRLFGPEVAGLVDGLTKIKRLDLVSKEAAQGENFRKLLLAVTADLRVLLVKLADRLHNMRTLGFMSPEKRRRIAQETVDIYAPLAGRMGIQEIRDELEDLSFRHLNAEAYDTVAKRLEGLGEASGMLVEEIASGLKAKLAAGGVEAAVIGRRKRPYSIWRKMERKSIAFEQLSDVYGFRIVVERLDLCYHSLGIVHTAWPAVPGRFKDYISNPKLNDYQSLHTTVIGPRSQRVELQIRTRDMEQVAEYGIAAHTGYKDGEGRRPAESRAYQWLRRTVDLLAEGDSPEEFLEHTRLELFHDQVFCFTPKGRLIALPRGANAIDFAFAVHTDVGNTAVGAKINGLMAPLFNELQNGDEVDIVRADGQSPPPAWQSLVVTGKARAAIRRAAKAATRRQYAGLGRQILDRAFQRAGKPFSDEKLRGALHRLARTSIDDVLAAVGRGEIFSGDVVRGVYPDHVERRAEGERSPAERRSGSTSAGLDALPIRGIPGEVAVRFSAEAGAVPGDRIVGIMNPGVGVTVYPIQSRTLATFDNEPERWIDVRWELDAAERRFPTRLSLHSINEPGSLAQIAQVIADHDGNIDNVTMTRRTADFTEMTVDLSVFDLKHLNSIVSELRAKPAVNKVERVTG